MNIKISTLITWAALLVLGQLLVTQWTVNAAGNRDVIDYVSFAGTVVGMILAILAIVYSYLANASQKSDSDALRNQVSNLNDAINRASVSGNQFANEVERLESVRESLALVVANSAANLKATEEIRASLHAVRADSEKPVEKPLAEAASKTETADIEVAALKLLARKALPRQLPAYYLAMYQQAMPSEKYEALVKELIVSTIPANQRSVLTQVHEGEIWGYYWILYDFGALAGSRNSKMFLKLLINRIDKLPDTSFGSMESKQKEAIVDALSRTRAKISAALSDEGEA